MNVTRAQLATPRRSRPTPRRERDVQKAIQTYLVTVGCVVVKVGNGGFRVGDRYVSMGHRGVVDILACMPPHGRMLACEVKAPGRHPTTEQFAFLAGVRSTGGLALVASSVDDVARALAPGRDGGGA